MYTIGQVSEMVGLPVSTLRYYDREGLFPRMERASGIRRFSEHELELLRVIECLKKSGLKIKDIRRFIAWCEAGPATYERRRELFDSRKLALEAQIRDLEKNLAMVKFKCWYYEQAIADGSEERLAGMLPDKLPAEIQALYDLARS